MPKTTKLQPKPKGAQQPDPKGMMRLTLAMPHAEWAWLHAKATSNLRSVSAELTLILRQLRAADA